ncbi:MAG: DUF1285 domain-containing protein [Alkalimonas sp.]|nr:DUF1285 domain-containing protein [Alkalimonas sp.]
MLTLAALQQQLEKQPSPIEQWDPPFCGDIDIRIQADGQWLYQSSPIGRLALVRLFASVLVLEEGEYFLKTPVEKVRIQVDDAPFLIQGWRWQLTEDGQVLIAVTNLHDEVIPGPEHPVTLRPYQGQPLPYVSLWRGLSARVGRNVFYQWIAEALEQHDRIPTTELHLQSGHYAIPLGSVDESDHTSDIITKS